MSSDSQAARSGRQGRKQDPHRPLLRDWRELEFTGVFVTMSLTDGKSGRTIDKNKLLEVVGNSRKIRGAPITAAYLDNPFGDEDAGVFVMKGCHTEKEDGSTGPVRCMYKAHLNTGDDNKCSVITINFKPNKPSGSSVYSVQERIRLDTKYACVHCVTDINGLFKGGDQTFKQITQLADHRKTTSNTHKRLRDEYQENLSKNIHELLQFNLTQTKVVARVTADPRFSISLEKMSLHNHPRDNRIFRLKYEPEVDPALQVVFESSHFGVHVTALVYANGRIVYVSPAVKYILKADELLRTGPRGSANGDSRSSSGESGASSTNSSGDTAAQRMDRDGSNRSKSGDYYPPTMNRELLPLFVRYRHPFAPQAR